MKETTSDRMSTSVRRGSWGGVMTLRLSIRVSSFSSRSYEGPEDR